MMFIIGYVIKKLNDKKLKEEKLKEELELAMLTYYYAF